VFRAESLVVGKKTSPRRPRKSSCRHKTRDLSPGHLNARARTHLRAERKLTSSSKKKKAIIKKKKNNNRGKKEEASGDAYVRPGLG